MAVWNRAWSTILCETRRSLAMTWAGMSRHQITVSMPDTSGSPCEPEHRCAEVPEPGHSLLEGQPQAVGGRPGGSGESRVVGLREVDETPVIAEVVGQQLRM